MFSENIEIIKKSFTEYKGSGMYLALFFVSLIYIFLKEDKKNIKTFLGYYSIAMLFVILNPLFNKCVNRFININVYWRTFWLLPIGFVISYSAVKIIQERRQKTEKYILLFAIICIIIISGKLVYSKDNFTDENNWYKLPEEAVTVSYIIGQDNEEFKKVMLPSTLVPYIRQIDANIRLAYGRQPIAYNHHPGLDALNCGDVEYVCKDSDCNYIIFKRETVLTISPEYYGYKMFSQTENYDIYKKIKE